MATIYEVSRLAGVSLATVSRVMNDSGKVRPETREKVESAMRELGYDLSIHASKGLDGFNGRTIDVAVTMGCGDECPLVLAGRREDWRIPDPRDMTPEEFPASVT